MRKLFILFAMFTCFISCDFIGKKHLGDLDLRLKNNKGFLYNKDGSVFTGTAWSSDEKTIKIEVTNGVITQTTMYHPNGNIAITGGSGNYTFYDVNGSIISKSEFKEQYPELRSQSEAIKYEFHLIN